MTGPLKTPPLEWRNGAPFDPNFGDIYFNPAEGLAETRHVFLDGNALPQAWAASRRFTIGELGFGTGLNFLATWELWQQTSHQDAHLHYISVEGAPMTLDHLSACHNAFPEFAPLSKRLRHHWPGAVRGTHRIPLAPNVTLLLLFGAADAVLPQLEAQVDAWFLDGFSPALNEAMWSQSLMDEVSRCSHVGSTLATFTAAGDVRHRLEQSGFEVERTKGFGNKKHMVTGRCVRPRDKEQAPWCAPAPPRPAGRVAVIGAGVAGLSVSTALATRGANVTLFDQSAAPGMGASGTPSGLVMPRLVADTDPSARFSAAAFRYAATRYKAAGLLGEVGGLYLATMPAEEKRFKTVAASGFFAGDDLSVLSPARVSEYLGERFDHAGMHIARGGALLGSPVSAFDLANVDQRWSCPIEALTSDDGAWQLRGASEIIGSFDTIIVTTGMDATRLLPDLAGPLTSSAGHVIRVSGSGPALPVTFGDYASPTPDGAWLGTTHEAADQLLTAHEAETEILSSLGRLLPNATKDWTVRETWRGVRATTPDRLPIAGPVPDKRKFLQDFAQLRHGAIYNAPPMPYRAGLYTITGLGSRGLVTAPLLGEFIATQVCGEPWPVERDVADALHPARFWVRNLIKGRVV